MWPSCDIVPVLLINLFFCFNLNIGQSMLVFNLLHFSHMLNLFWRFTEFLLMYVINSGNNHLFDRIKFCVGCRAAVNSQLRKKGCK